MDHGYCRQGKGFDLQSAKTGNGIINIQKSAEAMQATV